MLYSIEYEILIKYKCFYKSIKNGTIPNKNQKKRGLDPKGFRATNPEIGL
jgi:hypothetical protein